MFSRLVISKVQRNVFVNSQRETRIVRLVHFLSISHTHTCVSLYVCVFVCAYVKTVERNYIKRIDNRRPSTFIFRAHSHLFSLSSTGSSVCVCVCWFFISRFYFRIFLFIVWFSGKFAGFNWSKKKGKFFSRWPNNEGFLIVFVAKEKITDVHFTPVLFGQNVVLNVNNNDENKKNGGHLNQYLKH